MPVCATIKATADAPSVSYSGTEHTLWLHMACCATDHSHRFLPKTPHSASPPSPSRGARFSATSAEATAGESGAARGGGEQ